MKRGHPLGCARGPLPDREPAEGGTRTRGSVTAPRPRPRGILTVAPGRGLVWVVTGRPGPSARSPGGPQTVSDHGARPFPVLQARGPWSPRGSRRGRSRTRTTRGKKTDRSGPLGDERTEFTPVHERGLGQGPGCALSSPVAVLGTGGRKQSTRAPHRWGGHAWALCFPAAWGPSCSPHRRVVSAAGTPTPQLWRVASSSRMKTPQPCWPRPEVPSMATLTDL